MTDADTSEQLRKRPGDELPSPSQPPLACVVCDVSAVKYRCPRCERVTCSLACCLEHKRTFECDGKRDRTKFVALKQFSDANLSSDFFFLEEVARSANSAARSRTQVGADARQHGSKKRKVAPKQSTQAAKAINPHVPSDWLARFPVPFQLLVQHAAKRGVALTLLAPGMSKRVRNTSHMDTRTDKLCWRVEWAFPSADIAVNLAEERADDAQTPFDLLAQYLAKSPENATIRGKLRKYAVPDWQERVLLLLRREFAPASEPQYYRLDGSLSLESNLKRKAVVEFPVIIVALREDDAQYPAAHDRIEIVSTE
ncbi:hypothetical protein PybrP1_004362 [[Pythium] brassicae (nom. inval.)]|nr:hypothetical protein PybrP1_004362 [[Pythium] brassicae (nom. inval.)]